MSKFTDEELEKAIKAITSMINKCEKVQPKLKHGTPQRSLLTQRIKSLHIATVLLEKELNEVNCNQNMKQLKFSANLKSIVLSGEKYATWRLGDDYSIEIGDVISFVSGGEEFAKAKIISFTEVPFAGMTEEDKMGHEKYSSDTEKYATFSGYYGTEVGPDTLVKIYKFDLIK